MKILVTGAAGFIGAAVSQSLLAMGHDIVGIDNLNDYYQPQLKHDRLKQISDANFNFVEIDLVDGAGLKQLFSQHKFDRVIHLAAQAGVRYSIENPSAYVDSNLSGFVNILEMCRHNDIAHLVYASSSSVYGANRKIPFCENDSVDHPVSLYAASKKSNELIAHSYAHLYQLPVTGLRFFTVYGPWGRPDMAYYLFTKAIESGEPIPVFNHGKMRRDFTYIDDIVDGVIKVSLDIAKPDPLWQAETPSSASSYAPYRVYNIGNNQPVELMQMIQLLEKHLGKKALIEFKPMMAGDVVETYANIDAIQADYGFKPSTDLDKGLGQFVSWYRDYYKNSGN